MSDLLASSNQGDPTNLSLSNVNAAAKTACSLLKLKTGPLSMHQRKFLHVLVDTGNHCGVSLINKQCVPTGLWTPLKLTYRVRETAVPHLCRPTQGTSRDTFF